MLLEAPAHPPRSPAGCERSPRLPGRLGGDGRRHRDVGCRSRTGTGALRHRCVPLRQHLSAGPPADQQRRGQRHPRHHPPLHTRRHRTGPDDQPNRPPLPVRTEPSDTCPPASVSRIPCPMPQVHDATPVPHQPPVAAAELVSAGRSAGVSGELGGCVRSRVTQASVAQGVATNHSFAEARLAYAGRGSALIAREGLPPRSRRPPECLEHDYGLVVGAFRPHPGGFESECWVADQEWVRQGMAQPSAARTPGPAP